MYDTAEPLREHPSTYFVQDRSSRDEMARLEVQDKMLTVGMGGVLPGLTDYSHLRRVLDVGCGTGGWLMEMARTYPGIERLVGADVSSKMLTYASTRAEAECLYDRVRFQTMDALRILEFSPGYFDLVNQRLGASWVRTWEWTKLLSEYQRVTRPGGIIRITEMNACIESNSPALTKINNIVLETSYRSGRLFTPCSDGITRELAHLMVQHGIRDVQTRVHTVICRAGTVEGESFYEDMAYGLRGSLPFLQKWTNVPSNYSELCKQVLEEMQQPDFVATWTLLTAWGIKPKNGSPRISMGLP